MARMSAELALTAGGQAYFVAPAFAATVLAASEQVLRGAEPALVLSQPRELSAFDDGLLSASGVVQLQLNAAGSCSRPAVIGWRQAGRRGVVSSGAGLVLCCSPRDSLFSLAG